MIHLTLLLLLLGFFLIDLALPLDVASSVPYVICISLTGQIGIRCVWGTVLISSLLVLLGL